MILIHISHYVSVEKSTANDEARPSARLGFILHPGDWKITWTCIENP